MELKHIPAQLAIGKTVRTSLRKIVQGIGDWPTRIWNETQSHKLQVTGAPVYIYRGCGNDPEQDFELQICQPVASLASYTGEFEKIELRALQCFEAVYIGTMPEMSSKGWDPFMMEVAQSGRKTTGEAREVYIQWHDFLSPQNQVLLQMEVE